jgi:hypothetical protein
MLSQPCNHTGGTLVPKVCGLPLIHHTELLASRCVYLILERRTVAISDTPSRSLFQSLYKQWRICVKFDHPIMYNTLNTIVNMSEKLLNLRVNSGLQLT